MISGPLRVHPTNPRYFADKSGKPVFLCGAHTWAGWVEHKIYPEEPDFDWNGFLDFLVAHNHNFIRFWGWENARWVTWDATGRFFAYPLAYARTGPGVAMDGLPKFDLTKFDPEHFKRLRARVASAGERGIYTAVKFFDGFSVGYKGKEDPAAHTPERNPYRGHPFHAMNNVSGIDGDPDGTGIGRAIHTLRIPKITALQEEYVKKVIDTVNDLDNVLYEICNESEGQDENVLWQYHFIKFIKEYEAKKPKQHPVGMTVPQPDGKNRTLFESPADWISPNSTMYETYRENPPAADGRKVIVSDTDHLWGHGGTVAWVWKSFTRGMNLLLMDAWMPLQGCAALPSNYRKHPMWEPIRRNMGYARSYAQRMNLAETKPCSSLTSTGFCLANPGHEYLVYQTDGLPFYVDLAKAAGEFAVEWLNPLTGEKSDGGTAKGGEMRSFRAPFSGDGVLYLKARE